MGTWGAEPFDSDTAQDYLDQLVGLTAPQRLDAIKQTLEDVLGREDSRTSESLPEEVVAAAAVITANLESGSEFSWNEEASGVIRWLEKPISVGIRDLALSALDASIPEGNWWWQSWVDTSDREIAQACLSHVRLALRQG
ncbi:DUF4259 domain-containing protein [Streptomyces sp. AC512_CC834]|uniref:DUF4259 domain-containing protein n=1 Tax=Streptomyces sp. AC512_CC834 TaxID=2823691 RepID=UPI001C270CD5|nr:DUF4259 domain-containing protein [Streptomyces sp. AC512_CC834]